MWRGGILLQGTVPSEKALFCTLTKVMHILVLQYTGRKCVSVYQLIVESEKAQLGPLSQ